jgi:hypothetical protein
VQGQYAQDTDRVIQRGHTGPWNGPLDFCLDFVVDRAALKDTEAARLSASNLEMHPGQTYICTITHTSPDLWSHL